MGNTQLNNTLDKVTECINALEAMMRGEKPANVPAALQETLVRMYADFFIPETPLSHYTGNDEVLTPELARLKGNTSIHPISFQLFNTHDHLARHAHPHGYFNWKILGLDVLKKDENPLAILADADTFVLTRSSITGLCHGLHILKAKLQNLPVAKDKQLVIQSTQGDFWGPLIDHLGLRATPQAELQQKGIHITTYPGDSVEDTAASTMSVFAKFAKNADQKPAPYRTPITFDADTALLVASTATHKPREISAIFDSFHASTRVESLFSFMDKPLLAKEESMTCAGNNNEKRIALRNKAREIGLDKIYDRLRKQGIQQPEKAKVVLDDRALSFVDSRIIRTRAFDDVRKHMNSYSGKENPGAELSNLLTHLSWAELQRRVSNASDEIFEQTGKRPSTEIRDTACYIIVNLADILEENPPILSTFGVTRSTLSLDAPLGADGKPVPVMTSDQISMPLSLGGTRLKTEVCDYVTRHSEMMLALRTAARIGGIEGLEVYREPAAAKKFNASALLMPNLEECPYKVATFYSLITGSRGHGIDHLYRKLPRGTKLLAGNGGKYDPTQIFPVAELVPQIERCGDMHERLAEQSLARIRRLFVDADAFLYGPIAKEIMALPGAKWLMDLFFLGGVVGSQVSDPVVVAAFKGFFGVNFKGTYPGTAFSVDPTQAINDPTWGPQWRKYFHMMMSPVLKNKVDSIFHTLTGSHTELARAMVRHSATYTKRTPEDHVFKEMGNKADSDLYRVTLYSSASLANTTQAWTDTKNLTYLMAASGYAIRFGGGEEGLMRATAEGVHSFRAQHAGQALPKHHISAIQCQDTVQMEGLDKRSDYVCICPTREERMAKLMNTDAEVLLPGGAGSDEEKAATNLMRDLRLMPTRDRPFIIVNQEIDGYRPLDEIVRQITREERLRLNIHVVNHTSEVIPALNAARTSLQRRLGMGAIYNPTLQGTQDARAAHHLIIA
ncbi:MAG: hypothetical protein EBQ96_08915 [Proteobacteria bacterium]|nr:hypothetical protein [Pseudomonadota bacterium]